MDAHPDPPALIRRSRSRSSPHLSTIHQCLDKICATCLLCIQASFQRQSCEGIGFVQLLWHAAAVPSGKRQSKASKTEQPHCYYPHISYVYLVASWISTCIPSSYKMPSQLQVLDVSSATGNTWADCRSASGARTTRHCMLAASLGRKTGAAPLHLSTTLLCCNHGHCTHFHVMELAHQTNMLIESRAEYEQ